MKDVVLYPQEILALYASPTAQAKGETVMLREIHSQNQNIFLVVDTTCPIHKATNVSSHNYSNSITTICSGDEKVDVVLDMKDHDEIELDESNDALPDWLKNDLEDANADIPHHHKKRAEDNRKEKRRQRENDI